MDGLCNNVEYVFFFQKKNKYIQKENGTRRPIDCCNINDNSESYVQHLNSDLFQLEDYDSWFEIYRRKMLNSLAKWARIATWIHIVALSHFFLCSLVTPALKIVWIFLQFSCFSVNFSDFHCRYSFWIQTTPRNFLVFSKHRHFL